MRLVSYLGDEDGGTAVLVGDRLIPVFRIPQPRNNDGAAPALPAETAPNGVVRTMTKSVGRPGLEPGTY